jgi:DNA-binding MarR family transcriptional regulator
MSASETAKSEESGTGEESRLTGENATEAIRELPPSAKLVAKVLEYNDTLTQSQIAEESLLPDRTVRYALNRLDDEGLVDSRFSFSDARKRLYTLNLD